MSVSDTEPICYYPGNLNPTAPAFLPANTHPVPFFLPTRIYLPPPPQPLFFPILAVPLPPPPQLPPISMTSTRAVMLLPVPPDVTESSVRRDLEVFGEVRGVQMERADEGIVTVHFYDLRDSQKAVREIREHHHMQQEQIRLHGGCTSALENGLVSGRFVWAYFVFPELKGVPEGNNQGSLVIMNLEPTVSSSTLRHIFQDYGFVKELRETPYKKEQRFVEFFDVRDAAKALREMNGKPIAGKPVLIQFSRPGGLCKKFFLASPFNRSFFFNQHPPPTGPFRDRRKGPVKMKSSNAGFCIYEEQRQKKRNRRKHNPKKNSSDDCYVINEEAIGAAGCRDGRTTVMIKNIPNKYNQELLLTMLDTHCKDCNQRIISQENNAAALSSYDFVYLPIDFSNKCNVGYGFVNMTSPEAVQRLYKAFHNQHWGVFNSKKICEVTYARIQGVESLMEHFKKSRLPGVEKETYMPVLFSPPRDGRLLTEPTSVVDMWTKPEAGNSCHSDKDDDTVKSCLSDKKKDGSDGCLG